MPRERILIVEDEGIVQLHLRRIVEAAGYRVSGLARSGDEALRLAAAEPPDVVLMDIRLHGGLDGIETAMRLRSDLDAALVFVTAHADEDTLARAGRAVPMGYLVKPFEAHDVRAAIATALAQRNALLGLALTREKDLDSTRTLLSPASVEPFFGMVGASAAFHQLVRQIREVASGEWTVLIEGETGTGKELAARALHQLRPRRAGPFLPVNCGAFTESLAGSQLFGHKQGAFTGAVKEHQGLFEAAHGGTLFLDEVAELSPAIQASLLRVLEDHSVLQLGSSRPKKLDFRLIAATHQNLAEMARTGSFRQDLLYRLRVARVSVPPLRERGDDLRLLSLSLLSSLGNQARKPALQLAADALKRLSSHSWPGNVRELRSALEYAAIRCAGSRIEASDLPPEVGGRETRFGADAPTLDLQEALRQADGNHTQAARRLGISRATFYRRLARLSEAG